MSQRQSHESTPVGEAPELARQARSWRRQKAVPVNPQDQYSVWRGGLVVFFLGLGVATSLWLLFSPDTRQTMILSLGEGWARFSMGNREIEIIQLPPPPPRELVPRLDLRQLEIDFEADNQLLLEESLSAETEKPTFVPPPKTSSSRAAFQLLTQESKVAGSLVAGTLEGFSFTDWRPLKSDPREHWIDLIAVGTSDGSEYHLVWQVNLEGKRVEPLSQNARDLEARLGK